MARLKIPRSYAQSQILMVDDEPEHLDWLVDYLKERGFETTVTTSVRAAIDAIERTSFRAYLVDLNIPFGEWTPSFSVTANAYADYHGLYVLKLIRSQGNGGGRVLAYSAHSNEQIAIEVKRLYCRYIAKGRPRELKGEIERLLSHDPRVDKERARRAKVKSAKVGTSVVKKKRLSKSS